MHVNTYYISHSKTALLNSLANKKLLRDEITQGVLQRDFTLSVKNGTTSDDHFTIQAYDFDSQFEGGLYYYTHQFFVSCFFLLTWLLCVRCGTAL